jgi:hypothetical protein
VVGERNQWRFLTDIQKQHPVVERRPRVFACPYDAHFCLEKLNAIFSPMKQRVLKEKHC